MRDDSLTRLVYKTLGILEVIRPRVPSPYEPFLLESDPETISERARARAISNETTSGPTAPKTTEQERRTVLGSQKKDRGKDAPFRGHVEIVPTIPEITDDDDAIAAKTEVRPAVRFLKSFSKKTVQSLSMNQGNVIPEKETASDNPVSLPISEPAANEVSIANKQGSAELTEVLPAGQPQLEPVAQMIQVEKKETLQRLYPSGEARRSQLMKPSFQDSPVKVPQAIHEFQSGARSVKINIGRIEVRAVLQSPTVQPVSPPAKSAQKLTLDEYLKSQRGQNR